MGAAPAQSDDSVLGCALDAVRLLRRHAYYADRVDWAAMDTAVRAGADDGAPLREVLRPVLIALQDRHSFLQPQPTTNAVRTADPLPTISSVDGVPLIALPRFSGRHAGAGAVDYVRTVWRCLADLPARGCVVDLRDNDGGSVVPMLLAVGPLLGAGQWLRYRRRDGSHFDYRYAVGTLRANGTEFLTVAAPPPDLTGLPVALLTNRHTASAAEGVAIAFRGRARCRTFGEPTAGVPTGNIVRRLADGALLVITASIAVDRLDRTYESAVPPDAPGGPDEARAWLLSTSE